ncbi:MAG: CpaF family protein, partial [Steroidobacteraceae bacterium]
MSADAKSVTSRWAAKVVGDPSETADDRMRPLTPAERECKETIYQRLLKTIDLSLLATAHDADARRQIR